MTKKIGMRTIIVLMWFAGIVPAQNWVEERTYVSSGSAVPRVDGLLSRPIKGSLGSFVWFQVQPGYSQAYGGLTYSPKTWLELALGPGLEEDKHPSRIGSFVWAGGKHGSILFIAEDGGSGFWWKLEAMRSIGKRWEVGFLQERYKGSGGEIRFKVPRTPVTIWAAPLLANDQESQPKLKALFGIRFSL